MYFLSGYSVIVIVSTCIVLLNQSKSFTVMAVRIIGSASSVVMIIVNTSEGYLPIGSAVVEALPIGINEDKRIAVCIPIPIQPVFRWVTTRKPPHLGVIAPGPDVM